MAGSAAEERLRAKAVDFLRRERPGARIIHELNMAGTGSIRLDLAAVGSDHITLVEIKSEKDKLGRLKKQLEAAHRAANAVWVVITQRHVDAVVEMASDLSDTPTWAMMSRTRFLIENTAGDLQRVTHGQHGWSIGTSRDDVILPCPRHMWEMLWADEMAEELARFHAGRANMSLMTRFAVENMTGGEIRKAVCRQLRRRRFARADEALAA